VCKTNQVLLFRAANQGRQVGLFHQLCSNIQVQNMATNKKIGSVDAEPNSTNPTDSIGATGLPFNPIAEAFPLLAEDDRMAIRDDIQRNGQRDPIITYKGQVVDGRNRDIICKELGIKPKMEEWDGNGSLSDFIVSKNMHRRHLDESQRAMVAAKLKAYQEQEAKGKSCGKKAGARANLPAKGRVRDQVAKALKVSGRSVGSASKVLSHGIPELAKAVETGQVKVSTAAHVAELPPEDQAKTAAGGPKEIKEKAKQVRQSKAQHPKGVNTTDKASPPMNGEPASAPTECTLDINADPTKVAEILITFYGGEVARKVCRAITKLLDEKPAKGSKARADGATDVPQDVEG
jgi:hypothetical protein